MKTRLIQIIKSVGATLVNSATKKMTTIYFYATNEDFENATLIRRESINNIPGYRMTDRVRVRGAWEHAAEFKEMGREEFLDLVEKGGFYAFQNDWEESDGIARAFGWENQPTGYLQKANVL